MKGMIFMRFTEIAARLTGISTPVFGVSWNPPEAEVTAAKRIIAYLEDRRVLYQPDEMEHPSHCVASVLDLRRFFTDELGKVDPHEPLAQNLQAMRAACRKFVTAVDGESAPHYFIAHPVQYSWSLGSWIFLSALGDLRTTVGLHVAMIAIRNGLEVEDDLATVLPGELDDDGAVVLNW